MSREQFEANRNKWLPTAEDRAYVRSLMQPVHEQDKISKPYSMRGLRSSARALWPTGTTLTIAVRFASIWNRAIRTATALSSRSIMMRCSRWARVLVRFELALRCSQSRASRRSRRSSRRSIALDRGLSGMADAGTPRRR
jgi:hypothetical protein